MLGQRLTHHLLATMCACLAFGDLLIGLRLSTAKCDRRGLIQSVVYKVRQECIWLNQDQIKALLLIQKRE